MTALSRQTPGPARPEYEVETIGPADEAVDLQVALPGLRQFLPAKAVKIAPVSQQTPTGDTAQQLIGRWSQWMAQSTGAQVPSPIRDRLGKQVKVLILDKYDSRSITWALAIWAAEASNVGVHKCSPEQLSNIAWKLVMDTSQRALEWRETMKTQVRQMTPGMSATAVTESRNERRTRTNAAAFADFK